MILFFEFKYYIKNPDVVQIRFTNFENEISDSKTSTLFKTSTFFGVINDKKMKEKKTYRFFRVDVYVYQKGPFLKIKKNHR